MRRIPIPALCLALAALIGTSLLVAPCRAADDVRQSLVKASTLEQVLQRGVLKVGMSTFEPWVMQDKDGKFIGFEVDVAERLARDMGVKLEIVHTQWSGIIPALLTGKFDLIIGGMSIRADRALKVAFSEPYNYTGMSLVANREKAGNMKRLEDFDREDVTVAVRSGTTAAQAAKKYLPKAKLVVFEGEPQALQEVLNGKATAFVSMAPMPAFSAVQNPDKLVLPFTGTFTREPNAIALRKGDPDFLNYCDSWVRMVDAEGWFAERFRYWFETRDWEGRLPK